MRTQIYGLVLTLGLLTSGCAAKDGGTSTGNPFVSLKFAAFNASLSLKNEDVEPLAMSSLKMCFKRLRFKMANQSTTPDPTIDPDNIDFYLGEVAISNLGTDLAGIRLPFGTYTRVEMDLNNDCASGKSVQLTNSNGSFSTNDGMTIKFEGTYVHSSDSETMSLFIQKIVTALNTVNNNSQIRNKAESVSGSF